MKKHDLHHRFYLLIVAGLCINACSGQVNTIPPRETTNAASSSPKIIGTPPPLSPEHNPYNDTGLVSQYIRCIFQDSKGNYWFGPAGESVARYDPGLPDGQGETLQYYSRAEFFQSNSSKNIGEFNSVHAIAEDKEGNIWFGTDHGVVKYNAHQGKTFRSYTEKNGLSNTRVGRKSILVDQSGTMWVGTRGGAFRYIPSADSTGGQCFELFDLLPPIIVKDIMEDNAGNIWFASQNQGVFRYDPRLPEGQGESIQNIAEQEGLGDNYAGGMAQDKMGNMWFTMKGGICRYDARPDPPDPGLAADSIGQGHRFTQFTTKDGLGGSEVWGIFIEKSGIIWITARGSTTRFNPSVPITSSKAFRVFTVEDGLNCCVQSMYQDRSGNMWWGTGQGLYRFDGQRFYQVKQHGPW